MQAILRVTVFPAETSLALGIVGDISSCFIIFDSTQMVGTKTSPSSQLVLCKEVPTPLTPKHATSYPSINHARTRG
jgi:hypothetical protein